MQINAGRQPVRNRLAVAKFSVYQRHMPQLSRAFRAVVCISALSLPASALAVPLTNPLSFFEGKTEFVGTMKMVMKKPMRVRSVGRGKISSDGALTLVQQVFDEGQAPRERVWKIRQVGPNKYAGSMSEAKGPVTIEQVEGRYRFRFKLPGNMSVEQWLIPNADGRSGVSKLTVKKYGMKVASSVSVVRKLSD